MREISSEQLRVRSNECHAVFSEVGPTDDSKDLHKVRQFHIMSVLWVSGRMQNRVRVMEYIH